MEFEVFATMSTQIFCHFTAEWEPLFKLMQTQDLQTKQPSGIFIIKCQNHQMEKNSSKQNV